MSYIWSTFEQPCPQKTFIGMQNWSKSSKLRSNQYSLSISCSVFKLTLGLVTALYITFGACGYLVRRKHIMFIGFLHNIIFFQQPQIYIIIFLCARWAQLAKTLSTVFNAGMVEVWILGDFLLPHRPRRGKVKMIPRGLKGTQTFLKKSWVVMPVFGVVVRGHVWMYNQ